MRRLWELFALLLMVLIFLSACGQSVPGTTEDVSWQDQYDLGIRYLSEGNYEEAIIAFTAAIEIDPKRMDAYIGMADAYYGLGDIDGAIRILTGALEIVDNPDTLQEKLEEISLEPPVKETELEQSPEPIPGDWSTYGPKSTISVPLNSNIIASSGVQPVLSIFDFAAYVYEGRCDGYCWSTTDNVATILFGGVSVKIEKWSDEDTYMLDQTTCSPEKWQDYLATSLPASFIDSPGYLNRLEYNQYENYSELFAHEKDSSTKLRNFRGGGMLDSDVWYVILAAYDSDGYRAGYTVFELINTPDFLNAREQCTVVVNEITGEVIK